MKAGFKLAATLAGAALTVAVPATAGAAVTATVTGDDGNPLPLTAGVPAPIRNMDVQATGHVDPADAGSYILHVTGPDGVAASTDSPCWDPRYTNENRRFVDYRGNGAYTFTVSLFTDRNCATAKSNVTFGWNVGAFVSIAPPAATMFTRGPNSFSTITQQFNFAGNPGAPRYEIKYAKGAAVLPDGSLSSPALKDGYLDPATGKVAISSSEPGTYTVVARAVKGQYGTLWTPPVTFKLIAPFDISSRSFPDSRGPSYQVRGIVGEKTARGKVTVAIAKGKKGKKFRTLGKAKINSKGVFKLRFRVTKRGTYRLRYSFKGSANVARGTVYESIRIRRILI
ncbi:MAG TPA: hypothetical protein VNS09_01055 [Solirubrobacter sp.]|nr:hypothetical protein [Solirubrobacter sp.]